MHRATSHREARRRDEPSASRFSSAATRRKRASGERYIGVLIEGRPRIVDASAEGPGRMYTVQEQLGDDHGDEALEQIVANYIAQAQRLGRTPLAPRQA